MEVDSYTDQEIAQAILRRGTLITKEYLYKVLSPCSKQFTTSNYTDCENPNELINEIYVYILMPHRETHRSKLQDFGFRCTLTMWLKIVTENYCHQLFAKRVPSNIYGDSFGDDFLSIDTDTHVEDSDMFNDLDMEL